MAQNDTPVPDAERNAVENDTEAGLLSGEIGDNMVTFLVDPEVFSLEILRGAAFLFIDRCYVHLDKNPDGFVVRLKGKDALEDGELEALQGEFENELLNQSIRQQVNERNARLRELILAKAIFAGTSPDHLQEVREGFSEKLGEQTLAGVADEGNAEEEAELERLLAEIEEDLADDPLGIAIPWDEKYGKKADDSPKTESDKPEDDKGE